jgi:hypothetical protein
LNYSFSRAILQDAISNFGIKEMNFYPDIEQWRGFLLTCHDGTFFEIMRTSLGNIETPYNKQALIKKLMAHLRRKETKRRTLALISKQDAYLLTALYILGEPDLKRLYHFLSDDFQYLELHSHLLNLEERLLIYKDSEEGSHKLRFNPILFEELTAHVIDTNLVFGSSLRSKPSSSQAWLSDTLIASILSYIRENPSPLKAGGQVKKRTAADMADRFDLPGFKSNGTERLKLLLNAFLNLELISLHEGVYQANLPLWTEFGKLTAEERQCHISGALWSDKTKIRDAAGAVNALLNALSYDRVYSRKTLRHMLASAGITIAESDETAVLNTMVSLSILEEIDDGFSPIPRSLPHLLEDNEAPIVTQPNFEVTVKPETRFADCVDIALTAEIRRFNLYPVFEICRDSVSRRFADGKNAEALFHILENLNGSALPPNVIFSIDTWDKEYRSIRLFEGAVLVIEPGRRHLIEHSKHMSELITSSPVPGFFFLNTTDRILIDKALKASGIEQPPAIEGAREDDSGMMLAGSDTRRHFQIHEAEIPPLIYPAIPDPADLSDVTSELQQKLAKMKIDPDVLADMQALIEKRLILYPEQLDTAAATPRVSSEARGFDYLGKVRLIEQALIRDDVLLEIMNRGNDGESVRYLVKAIELKKTGSDLNLICQSLPDLRDLKIHVRSISLIKKVRGSLFVE